MTESDYNKFFKKELFPKVKTLITDELLLKNGWHKYSYYKDYYFDNGDLGRINYSKSFDSYSLEINYNNPGITVKYLEDIKANVYAYVNSMDGEKYGYDPVAKGYKYLPLDNDEERYDYRYNKYLEMIKTIEKV